MADLDCLTTGDMIHDRVIAHVDVDYFYAQVEMLKNPELQDKPVGVRQRHMVVTSNLRAREFGVKKCMLTTEALKLCPDLVVVPGEDLSDYRDYSKKIFNIMREFSDDVEKLGLDENYIDITHIVQGMDPKQARIEGHVYNGRAEKCSCGCYERLCCGSMVAKQIRDKIKSTLGLKTCAGVAHNKFLAKLIGKAHKPDDQTLLFPCAVMDLMSSLDDVRKLTGIGPQTTKVLNDMGIFSVLDLQNVSTEALRKVLSPRTVDWLKSICFGVDHSEVKTTGKPKNISAEEANPVDKLPDLKNKCLTLLERLTHLMKKDGRRPTLIRVSVKIFDSKRRFYTRISKQCPISPTLFPKDTPPVENSPVMNKVLSLLKKLINLNKFHIRLISIGFGNFIEQDSKTKTLFSFRNTEQGGDPGSDEDLFADEKPSLESPNSSRISSDNNEKTWDPDESRSSRPSLELPTSSKESSDGKEGQPIEESEEIPCPPGVDRATFRELPLFLQKELSDQCKVPAGGGKKSTQNKGGGQTNLLNFFSKKVPT